MFSFFQAIFQKITYVATSIAITVGLVSTQSPAPIVEAPIEMVQEVKEETGEFIEKPVKKPEITSKQIIPPPVVQRVLPSVPESKSVPAPEPVPLPVIPPPPPLPIKILKVKADKPEIWASGFHYVNFGFEYLVDGKLEKAYPAQVYIEKITPSASIPANWQIGVSTNQILLFSTKVPGNHTLTFSTNTGVKAEITVIAKEWPDRKDLEVVPIQTKSIYNSEDPTSVFLGSFRVRTNPDIGIRLYDCNISSASKFESYKIKIEDATDSGNNNCFNILVSQTDSNGLSKDEFHVYLNKPSSGGKFYLNDISVREIETGIIHYATSSLKFDLKTEEE